ncbi:MAG: translation initiation factor [Chloroflexi bacterium]|nr:translation initiation factor [Chloroflexota bacterium]
MRPTEDRRGPRNQVRINEQIRARVVLVIDSDGSQLGQMPIADALKIARDKSLDLVEVSPLAQPPVCRILDYGRQQYEQSRKEREARKNQTKVVIKEVRVRPKTDPHDLDTKLRAITKWLQEGDRVQLTLRMRGREQAHPDWGRKVLVEMASKVGDVGRVERDVLAEGRQMTLVLAPSALVTKKSKPSAPPPEQPSAGTGE